MVSVGCRTLFCPSRAHKEPHLVKAVGPDGNKVSFPVTELKVFRKHVPPLRESKTDDGTRLNPMRMRLDAKSIPCVVMATIWERSVLAIIGESLENAEHINGFVISGKPGRWFVEAWLGIENRDVFMSIKKQLEELAQGVAAEFNERNIKDVVRDTSVIEYYEKN